jgi:hypothetical protein
MIQGPLAVRKPDGIDFVGNSKISSFCKNPPPTARYRTYGIIILIRPPSARGLPARGVERADGALAPRQRDAFVPIELSEPRADVRQDVVVKWDYAPSTVVPWGHGLGRARASARSIAQHKRSENEGGRRNPVKSGASVRSSRAGFASIAPFRARRDRGRLPPTTGPVCQGWAIPSRAKCRTHDLSGVPATGVDISPAASGTRRRPITWPV